MKKKLLYLFLIPLCSLTMSAQSQSTTDIPALLDKTPETYYEGTKGVNKLIFTRPANTAMLSYKIYSSGQDPKQDPASWKLKGSVDGKKWVVVDERKDQTFCSRFQEDIYAVQTPGEYTQYMFEMSAADKKSALVVGEIILFEKDILVDWKNFHYPNVEFNVLNPEVEGSKIYLKMVQNPDEYIKYHTQKVAEMIYWTDKDSVLNIQNIRYDLKDQEGISAKNGGVPNISIFYSTRWVESKAKESPYVFDRETRGVLYHELTHGYQYEPKNCGRYDGRSIFWSNIEGLADGVRIEARLFEDMGQNRLETSKNKKKWMAGYRVTGYFLQWLKSKDPDALRKFNKSAADLPIWTWDNFTHYIFPRQYSGVHELWDEYIEFLSKPENKDKFDY